MIDLFTGHGNEFPAYPLLHRIVSFNDDGCQNKNVRNTGAGNPFYRTQKHAHDLLPGQDTVIVAALVKRPDADQQAFGPMGQNFIDGGPSGEMKVRSHEIAVKTGISKRVHEN